MIRQHAPSAYASLKSAWKVLVGRAGGVEALAAGTRVGIASISGYGAQHMADSFPPADVVLDAELLAEEPLVTAALARAQGFSLIPVETRDSGDLAAHLVEISRGAAQLFADSACALRGPGPTAEERDRIARDLDVVARAALETRRLVTDAPPRHWGSRR